MRILVVGGGPAGLYFALLMKRRDPRHEVTVLERNPRDTTFGWGVVFSEQTLSYLADPDPPTFRALDARLARWDNVDIVHRGEKVTIRGNRFSGIPRLELLDVLQRRCEELGVDLRFARPIAPDEELPPADLVVGADGVRSVVRERFAAAFGPAFDVRRNRYIWLGTPRLFHGLTLTFRAHADGLFIAHSYKYGRDRSTFIVECDPESWRRAGLGEMDEEEGLRYLERLFADDLAGAPLLSNASRWLQFATLRNRRWSHGNVVLLGDALHTAHFSIGSGTKLALEDAIALAGALDQHSELPAALAAFERSRRPHVERYQSAAEASAAWFEGAAADLHLDPLAFAYRAMVRSERLGHANLKRRDPEFVAAYERSLEAAQPPAS
ncbi:MAG TPA: FAD-dependent monooxygenase [Thermoanaerobaculia bacterium]|nr:FAD-dependent monooxygenase [Thermoanaerobaculia bacterium]